MNPSGDSTIKALIKAIETGDWSSREAQNYTKIKGELAAHRKHVDRKLPCDTTYAEKEYRTHWTHWNIMYINIQNMRQENIDK
jgi:hypothetical protein